MIGELWPDLKAFCHEWDGAIRIALIAYLVFCLVLAEWRRQ